MSEEQLKAFLEKVKSDTSLQEKLNAATEVDDVIAIAKEAGFMISAEVLKKDQPHIEDVELEGAAGGQGCVSALVPGMLYTNGCVRYPQTHERTTCGICYL